MSNNMKCLLCFTAGLGLGIGGTVLYNNLKHKQTKEGLQERVELFGDEHREYTIFDTDTSKYSEEELAIPTCFVEEESGEFRLMEDILNRMQYAASDEEIEFDVCDPDEVYIDPDEEATGYWRLIETSEVYEKAYKMSVFTKYSDGVYTDNDDNPTDIVNSMFSEDLLEIVNELPEKTYIFRNDKLQQDFYIIITDVDYEDAEPYIER